MSKKEAAQLVAQREPHGMEDGNGNQSSDSTPILPNLPQDVKVLRDFIKRRHIPMMDMLEVVKTIYPRCDKSLLSKCAHGEETGAKLRGDAMRALMVHFHEDGQKKPVQPVRKKPHRTMQSYRRGLRGVATAHTAFRTEHTGLSRSADPERPERRDQ